MLLLNLSTHDGKNLYLIQRPNGSLFWQMTYRYQSDKHLKPKQKTYQIGEALDVFKIDERMNFYRIDLDKTPLEDHDIYRVNFRKSDLARFALLADHSIFKAVDKSYFNNNLIIDDTADHEFLTIA